ncbi:MAG: c-type cytochrome, partial [Pirellulales bacterium]|nr:c-type cytochrome [Pirellulales bacterium]
DKLLWPTGVVCWQGGVFIAAAPDIWYLRDEDGDGVAERRERVFTGFGVQNEQGTVNNLVWGPDNRIYGSASTNGGRIATAGSDEPEVMLDGQDFRFDPRTRKFEAISGRGQFGCAFDDWGRRFVCTESKPLYHVVLERAYLKRNPYLAVGAVLEDLAPGVTPVFRTSPIEPWRAIRTARRLAKGERRAESAGASHEVIDAAAGLTIYRGDAYPAEYRGNFFVGCSQTNLIHRRTIAPRGVTFASQRADEQTEFVRSTDTWFRPVNLVHAPDGTLLVLDMCREVIEAIHIPLDVVAQLDLTSGRDRGRIYRLAPADASPRQQPPLGPKSTVELAALLQSTNGWTRDTASRLIYERGDQAAVPPLRELLRSSAAPLARWHALHALAGLEALNDDDLCRALDDEVPQLREAAVALAEPRLTHSTDLLSRAIALADDTDVRVRMQVACSLGMVNDRQAVEALARIARSSGDDAWLRAAVLSSLADTAGDFLAAYLTLGDWPPQGWAAYVDQAAFFVGSRNDAGAVHHTLTTLAALAAERREASDAALIALGRGLKRHGRSLSAAAGDASSEAQEFLARQLAAARDTVASEVRSLGERRNAMQLLAGDDRAAARPLLVALVSNTAPDELRLAAIETLLGDADPEVAAALISAWPNVPPNNQAAIVATLLSTRPGIEALFDALERGELPSIVLGAAARTALEHHADAALADRARRLLAAQFAGRESVIADYRSSLELAGDAMRGETIYQRECQACHRLGNRGHQVGPNLALTRNRTPEALLVAILDPNRDVQPQFVQQVVITTDGRTYAGIVDADTPTSLTLRRDQGQQESILKADVEQLSSTGKSLMPEGFERTVDKQSMADLLAFLQAELYDIGTEPGLTPPAAPDEGANTGAGITVEARQLVATALGTELLAPGEPLAEARAFLEPRVAQLPPFDSADAWRTYAADLRQRVLREIVFRGRAAEWRDAAAKVELLDTQPGKLPYSVTRLRFEVLPGMWIPALLYAPAHISAPVPAVLNLNGHESEGMNCDFKQARCVNLALRGMIALNVEWFGMGQLRQPGFTHSRLNQVDLCGSSGFAPFFLAMTRALDLLEHHPQVNAAQIAVTGLSGGGLQTAFLMGLDERVAAAAPVAGFCSQRTALWSNDLGDSEHVPSDLAALADFTHLAALRSGRWTLLTYNADDDCCFRPAQVLAPVRDAAHGVFALLGAEDHLRTHVNVVPGTHNYERENREALYGFLARSFGLSGAAAAPGEIDVSAEIRPSEALKVSLPEDNVDFNQLAVQLARDLPCQQSAVPPDPGWQTAQCEQLVRLLRIPSYDAQATIELVNDAAECRVVMRRLRLADAWTLPAVEFVPKHAGNASAVLVIADAGRAAQAETIGEFLSQGRRVLAIDPLFCGESQIVGSDPGYLFALLAMGVGERPLGIQAAQLVAVGRWYAEATGRKLTIAADGPRTCAAALVAAAVETRVFDGLRLHGALASLKQLIEQNSPVDDQVELFAFGLLEQFDLSTIAMLVYPQRITWLAPDERLRREMQPLADAYRAGQVAHDPFAP